jgi:hypothetical protein
MISPTIKLSDNRHVEFPVVNQPPRRSWKSARPVLSGGRRSGGLRPRHRAAWWRCAGRVSVGRRWQVGFRRRISEATQDDGDDRSTRPRSRGVRTGPSASRAPSSRVRTAVTRPVQPRLLRPSSPCSSAGRVDGCAPPSARCRSVRLFDRTFLEAALVRFGLSLRDRSCHDNCFFNLINR